MIVVLEDFHQGVIEKSGTRLVRSDGKSLLQSAGHDFAYKSLATRSITLLLQTSTFYGSLTTSPPPFDLVA